jgi:hypothetical protein
MRIGDIVYFAPGIRFSDIVLHGEELPEQFESRIEAFYLKPAHEMAHSGHAFASGLLLVSCIDALARIESSAGVGDRFRSWVKDELQSFNDGEIARRFYEEFRNGLVHEARIKNGGQFSLEQSKTVDTTMEVLSINPKCLAEEVGIALDRYVDKLRSDGSSCDKLRVRLKEDFRYEFS